LQQAPEYAPIQFAGHEAGEFFLMPTGARSADARPLPGLPAYGAP